MAPTATSKRQQMLGKLRYLSQVDIFQDLSQEDLNWMDTVTTTSTYERGNVFYSPSDSQEVLFLLKSGRVQLYRMSAEGKKLIVTTLTAGSIFGEMSMIGQGMYDSYALALEKCKICVMSREDLERVLVDKPQVGLRIVETLGRRLREVETRLEDIAFKNIPARLASLLLRMHAEYGIMIEGYTHQDLAEMIGTYRETTTQTLNEFKRGGLIGIGRKRLELYDLAGLQDIAEQ